jgi:hypothetical protein
MPKLFLTVILGVLSSSCATADTDLNKILTAANGVVKNATKVEVAKLKPAPAESVMKNALSAPNTIAGFPIKGELKSLSLEKAKAIAQDILNTDHYADIMQRCVNDSLIGIRFTNGKTVVEFAYSQPCQQAFWAMNIDGKLNFASSVLGPDYSKAIKDLL